MEIKYKNKRDGINQAQEKASKWIINLEEAKIICFSDLHRGNQDGADDFLPCEETYKNALKFYLENGYNLILLGDVEELWENNPLNVLKNYEEILNLENEFHLRHKLHRIWGNHDDLWQFPDALKLYLHPKFKDLQVFEAISMDILKDKKNIGNILWLHGHQGTILSSKFTWFSKFVVRFFWRPLQRIFNVPLETAASHPGLRSSTDFAMDLWSNIRLRQLIVCGHTHDGIFGSQVSLEDVGKKPSYFNTGCCSYGNGNISGIEISNEKIRLVEWKKDSSEPYYIAKEDLEKIFERCE